MAIKVCGSKCKAISAGGVSVDLHEGRLVWQAELVILLDVIHLVLVGEQDASLRCSATVETTAVSSQFLSLIHI